MTKLHGTIAAVFVVLATMAAAAAPTTKTATSTTPPKPGKTKTPTTTSAPARSKEVQIVHDLEAAGKKHATLKADIVYTLENSTLGDVEIRRGWIAFQQETKKDPSRIRIHFKTLKQNEGREIRNLVDYAFDGEFAFIAEHAIKKLTKYELAPPGKKVRAMTLGKGPLPPLPFGQKAVEVLKRFKPSTRPTKPSEPKNTVYLRLDTRRKFRKTFDYVWMELWIDRKTYLPVKIIGKDKYENLQTVELSKLRTNVPLDKTVFHLPRKPGWKMDTKRYGATE